MGFRGGQNIAMKVPPHQWDETVRFYEEILGLGVVRREPTTTVFEFGTNRLWIDRVNGLSQAEVWLELVADDVAAAQHHLARAGVPRRDEIEPLPHGFAGFWISSPASIIHLVAASGGDAG